jgi:tetratricopeptide (TPR) repeat protein
MKRADIESEAGIKRSNARKLRQNGDPQAAMRLYEDAFRLYKRIDNRVLQYDVLKDMGDTTCEMENFSAARDYYEHARAVFKNKLPSRHNTDILKCLKDVSLKERDFPRAYRELKQFLTLTRDDAYILTLLELAQVTDQLGDTANSDAYFARCVFLTDFKAMNPLKLWGQALFRRGEQHMACQLYRLVVSVSEHSAGWVSSALNTKEYFFGTEDSVDRAWSELEALRQELKAMGCDEC